MDRNNRFTNYLVCLTVGRELDHGVMGAPQLLRSFVDHHQNHNTIQEEVVHHINKPTTTMAPATESTKLVNGRKEDEENMRRLKEYQP